MNLNTILSALGSAFGIIGAILLASNIGFNEQAYYIFFISAMSWFWYGIRTNNRSIMSMNFVFAVINLYGAYNYIGQ